MPKLQDMWGWPRRTQHIMEAIAYNLYCTPGIIASNKRDI